jgi:hypothetical protein
MNDAEIERLYRIKASLSPERRAEIERLHAEMLARSSGPMSPSPVRSWGPEDLDPVEAAAAPITPDPIAGPVRNRSRADWATDAATGGGLYSPSENVASMDVTDVPPPAPVGNASAPAGYDEWAAAVAEVETGKTKAERLAEIDALERRQDAQKAAYDQATGMPSPGGSGLADVDEAGRDWSGWTPGMPLPAAGPSGAVLADNARRAEEARVREADALARNEAIGAKYGPQNPQARAIAEAGDAEGVTDYRAVRTPAEQKRIDERRGYEWDARNGNQAARDEIHNADRDGAVARNKIRAAAATTGTSGMPSEAERWNNYRAQMMLAGSNPRKNQANAFSMMNDPIFSPQQQRALQYMLPGGQLAAGVEAQNMQNANTVIQRFMTSGAAAGAGGPMAEAQAAMAGLQAQAERDRMRLGDENVLGEKYAPGDKNWLPGFLGGGYDEFTVDEQQQMYDDLIKQGYRPAEAQRAVDRQANKRRASARQSWNTPGA